MNIYAAAVNVEKVTELLARGTAIKWSGRVTFLAKPLEHWSWPLTAIRGATDGPTVTVIGATHGGEYVGVLTVLRLARALTPDQVRGTLFLLPVLDLPSFWGKVPFVCPIDGKDPAACFPGDPHGSFTEVMCHHMWKSLLEPSDGILDLHGGDICEDLIPFTIMQLTGNTELDARTELAARAYGFPYLVIRPLEAPIGAARRLLSVAGGSGKVALVAELGDAGKADPADVQTMYEGTLNSLGCLGSIEQRPFEASVSKACQVARVTAPRDGCFVRYVGVGSHVQAGQLLGRIADLAGEFEDELYAPTGGVLLFGNRVPAASKGAIMFGIGHDIP